MHPGISADIINCENGEVIGTFGRVHPKVCKNFEISNNTLYCELNLEKLVKLEDKKHSVKMLSKFPAVDRDLAIVCSEDVTVGQILESVKKSCGSLFHSAKVFDIYRSEQLGENKKSIAFSFKLVSYDKTLTDEEISQTVNKILKDLKYKCGAELR
jgi:phenylalanyl-tRNA synthetase beta chain